MVRKLLGLMIVIAAMVTGPPVVRADTLTVSNLAASNATATISAPSMGTVTFVVSGTFSATLTPKCSVDGINYQTATVTGPYPSTSTSTSITGAGTYQFTAAGWSYFQLVATSYSSGTAAVTEYASTAVLGGGSSGGGGGGVVTQSDQTQLKGTMYQGGAWSSVGVTGTFWQTTQPISAASLPLPTLAATSTLQPGFGTAGSPSSNVSSMQGVSGGTPVPVLASQNPTAIAYTDNSSTVATGGTSQQITAANSSRHVVLFYNLNALGGDVEYINFGAAATATNSIPIYPGGGWQSDTHTCPSGTINILGATTGDKYMEKEN